MTTLHYVPDDLHDLYHVFEWRNAAGVLTTACPAEWQEIINVLRQFRLYRSEIERPGGRKSPIAGRLDGGFYDLGWVEKRFDTSIIIDGEQLHTPTHSVDCFKGKVALEVEWNNKDPFFDRDLNNFRLLYDLRAIDVGVIITRSTELQSIFDELGKGSSYGSSTTHHEKLLPRLDGGGGGGCPILAFAISKALYVDDSGHPAQLEEDVQA
ncbi:BglII/BstYI family type II restriction endonuclease [Novispirillum itersonii]|uniref:BglII/BstYI family type II restriction endonuclease n=1 Tax=Novispirillum itersonii TaxID=189 RepID=UPI00037F0CAD|nr:BglII/BstYI family type II restriction endonuclease [Novispirillum itersonii]